MAPHLYVTLGLRALCGSTLDPRALVRDITCVTWRSVFEKLARIAALAANSPLGSIDPLVRKHTVSPLALGRFCHGPLEREIGTKIENVARNRPIANQQSIEIVQALALMHGADEGVAATEAQVAFFLLAANDHIEHRNDDATRQLSRSESLVADFLLLTQYNRGGDARLDLVRAARLLEARPARGHFSSRESWEALERSAFGGTFADEFDRVLGPLAMHAALVWGLPTRDGLREPPEFAPSRWYSRTGLSAPEAERSLKGRVWTREAVRAELTLPENLRRDGLPMPPTVFARRPLVLVEPDRVVASSPWAVREHVRLGPWAAMLAAAKVSNPARGGKHWLETFGDVFEGWCREVARGAAQSDRFVGRLELSAAPGDHDEIEDVVVTEDSYVVLFSAKARAVPESKLKRARTRGEAIDLLESVFFARAGEHSAGAARLLDKKVNRIRAGEYRGRIAPDVYVYPVLVTFDEFGESPPLYLWLEERCREMGLLVRERTAPLTVIDVRAYEALMRLASRGLSLVNVLHARFDPAYKYDSMETTVSRLYPDAAQIIGEANSEGVREVFDRIAVRLFGRALDRR